MGWTPWRRIADSWCWYADALNYDGPSCYELGTRGPGGSIKRRYVGDAENERARVLSHAKCSSHLGPIITRQLDLDQTLYVRSKLCATKFEAQSLQDVLLRRHHYDWNALGTASGLAPSSRLVPLHRGSDRFTPPL